MKYQCQECGDSLTVAGECDPWECVLCGGEVVPANQSETVPKEDLEALVEEWRERGFGSDVVVASGTYMECADELAEVLEG